MPASSKTPAGCEERSRLLQAYNDATREFSERVSALNARIGVTQKHEYELLERAAEDARLKSEQARIAYERHVADHGC
jgi:hypothetical protein